MRRTSVAVLVTATLAVALALLAIHGTRTYGVALFIGVPFLAGFGTTALIAKKPRDFAQCVGYSFATVAVAGWIAVLGRIEGLICLAALLPLATPLVILGALPAWWLFHARRLRGAEGATGAGAALLVFAIAIEPSLHSARPPVYVAAHSVVVDAPPAEVWQSIVTLSDITPPDDLLFRAGIACPQTSRIARPGQGGLRVCTMSTGTVLERIDAWEPGRVLGWRALATPPPMKELNPFGEVDAPHLHGFYRNVRGEFALEPLPGGRTRLTRRTWYEHDMYPSAYWRIWFDLGAAKVHRLVLEHVRDEVARRRGAEHV